VLKAAGKADANALLSGGSVLKSGKKWNFYRISAGLVIFSLFLVFLL